MVFRSKFNDVPPAIRFFLEPNLFSQYPTLMCHTQELSGTISLTPEDFYFDKWAVIDH